MNILQTKLFKVAENSSVNLGAAAAILEALAESENNQTMARVYLHLAGLVSGEDNAIQTVVNECVEASNNATLAVLNRSPERV